MIFGLFESYKTQNSVVITSFLEVKLGESNKSNNNVIMKPESACNAGISGINNPTVEPEFACNAGINDTSSVISKMVVPELAYNAGLPGNAGTNGPCELRKL